MRRTTQTTITLEPDVAARLRELSRERGVSFEEAVNAALRCGLADERSASRPFRVKASPLGLLPGVDLDKPLALAAGLEDEETIRRLELRKRG
jgi:hypothetical protein